MEILSHKVMTLHNRLLETKTGQDGQASFMHFRSNTKYLEDLIGEMITLISEPEK